MTDADRRLADGVARAFDYLARSPIERKARIGASALLLQFASAELDCAFDSFAAAASDQSPEFAIGFAGRQHVDLSGLIPDPPVDSLIFNDRIYALWQPTKLPVLQIFDRATKRGLVWLPQDRAPAWFRSRPALPLVHAQLINTAWTPIHAAAIGRNGRVALLAGKGGAGKTTAALACARGGWDYAGDDFVLVHSTSGRIEPLYTSARLRQEIVEAFTDILDARAEISLDDLELRHEMRLAGYLPDDRIKGGQLAAILLPRRSGARRCKFQPARRVDAIEALLTVTTTQIPGWQKEVMAKLVTLIGLAPTFFVDTGETPADIPHAFDEFLNGVGA